MLERFEKSMPSKLQIYHLCNRHGTGMAFECPGGTRFQQRTMVCDHWNQVKCSLSDQYYAANLRIGQKHLNFIDDGNDKNFE